MLVEEAVLNQKIVLLEIVISVFEKKKKSVVDDVSGLEKCRSEKVNILFCSLQFLCPIDPV
jgi:hypothetical protein